MATTTESVAGRLRSARRRLATQLARRCPPSVKDAALAAIADALEARAAEILEANAADLADGAQRATSTPRCSTA